MSLKQTLTVMPDSAQQFPRSPFPWVCSSVQQPGCELGKGQVSESEPRPSEIYLCLLDSLALILPDTVAFTNARKTPSMSLYGSEDTVHAEQSRSAGPFTTRTLCSYGVWAQISRPVYCFQGSSSCIMRPCFHLTPLSLSSKQTTL